MRKYYSTIFLLFMMASTAKTKIIVNDITSNKNLIEFSDLAIYMTKRFMSSKTSTIVITEKCEVICSLEQKYHTALLTNIIFSLCDSFAVQLFLGHYNERLWDYNIFIVDSPEAFVTLRNTFPSTQHERFFNFFILLTWSAKDATERYVTLLKIFRASVSFSVRNVVVMNKSFEGNHISFYTYELSHKGNCRHDITIREINRYENGTLQNEMLFPGYINNFHGCYLNVSAHVVEPLLSFDGDMNNGTHLIETSRLSGIEGDILKLVAESLNFKISLRFPKGKHVINMLFNSSGAFADLESDRSHIVIGGFSSTIKNGIKFTRSLVYHTTPFVFVVCTGFCFGPIKQLLNPLCPSTWALLLIFFSFSFIFTKMMQINSKLGPIVFGCKNSKPICSMFVIFFGNALPAKILPKKDFARVLLAAWLLLSFQVRNGYQGKMFDSLRFSKRIPVPKKISHLLDQDYTMLSPMYSDFYPANKTQIVPLTTVRLEIVQLSSLRLTATALLDSLAYYNFMNYNTSTLTYVEEVIHTMPCVMYFQKHSIFRSSIDHKLKRFSDAGITSYIAKKHVDPCFQNMNTESQFEVKLRNNNLKGIYFISVVMFSISIVVFVLELLTLKSNKLQKAVDALNSF